MGFSLKDKFNEVAAQVNMRDGGRTAKTVRNERQAVVAQTKKKPSVPYYGSFSPQVSNADEAVAQTGRNLGRAQREGRISNKQFTDNYNFAVSSLESAKNGVARPNVGNLATGLIKGMTDTVTKNIPNRLARTLPKGNADIKANENLTNALGEVARVTQRSFKKGNANQMQRDAALQQFDQANNQLRASGDELRRAGSPGAAVADAVNVISFYNPVSAVEKGVASTAARGGIRAAVDSTKLGRTIYEAPQAVKTVGVATTKLVNKAMFSQAAGAKGAIVTGAKQGAITGATNELYNERPTVMGAVKGATTGLVTGGTIGGAFYGAGKVIGEAMPSARDAKVHQRLLQDDPKYTGLADQHQGASKNIEDMQRAGIQPPKSLLDYQASMERAMAIRRNEFAQGGYLKVPNGKNDPAPNLSKEQKTFVNDYAEMLEGMDAEQKGGFLIPDGEQYGGGYKRTTSHSKFYSDTFAEKGRAPTKADWFNEAKRQIDSGNAAYGASDEYKAIAPQVGKTADSLNTERQILQTRIDKYSGNKAPTAVQLVEGAKKRIAEIDKLTPALRVGKTPTIEDALAGRSTKPRTQLTGKQLDTPNRMFTDPNGPEATAIARNNVADMPKKPTSYEESLMQQEPAFNAPAASPTSNSGKRTLKSLEDNPTLRQAEAQASQSGREINLFAKKDRNGRSVGVEQFDPETMRIEAGFVVDNNGNVLGNHIKVDETGIQINIGGKVVPMNGVIGNPLDWQGTYRVTETMDRNLKRLAPDEDTYRASREYLIDHKNQSEATFKTDLQSRRQELGSQADVVKSAKPRGVSDTDFNADIFDYIENKVNKQDLNTKYGKDVVAKIEAYKSYTRNLYDDLLENVNETFVKFGEKPVEARKDYITHLNELTNKKSFAGDMYESLRNGILGEADGKTRGEVPTNIAGRTENFQPNKKWNRFFQRRTGDTYTKDPFKAVDAYLEPALYNIHMTESAMRARGVEAAFRTASELKDMDLSSLSEEMQKALRAQGDSQSRLVTGFQEYANALAGKTQRLDRNIIDMGGGTALKGWQQLQRIGAQSTILGNVNSVISQTLGQPIALADVGVKNYIKGIARSFGKNPEIEQSAFIKARSTNVDSPFKSNASKVLDAGGVPLQQAELAMVKLAWNGQYEKALAKGLKGKKAILEADRATEQVVAGRGIADKPEIYRSTAANGILQYTLEVAAQNKKVWQDFTPAQKAKFVVAAFAMNSLVGQVTGQEPLPDFLGATIDTVGDFTDKKDDRNAKDKAIGGAQRAAGEFADMNPFVAALANNTLPTDTRKKIFGEDSGVGRFEGTAAPIKVVQKGASAAINASQGKFGAATKDAAGLVPYGNQASKTVQGIQTINRGYAVDNSGNPTYAAPTTLAGKAQAVVFGTNSTPNAQKFYDNNQTSITGKKDLAMINESSNKLDAVSQIQQRRAEAKMNKEQKAKYDAMSDAQKQAYAANVDRGFVDAGGNLMQESASKTQAKIEKFKSELPKGISEESSKVLTNYDRLTTIAKQKYIADPKNELAYTKAKLERGTLEKTLTAAQAKTLQTKIDKLSGKTPAEKTTTKKASTKSSGSKRSTFNYKMLSYGNPATSLNSKLQALLDGTKS